MSQNHGPNFVTDGLLTCIDMANPGPKLQNNFSGPDKYYEDRSGNGNHAVRGIQGGYILSKKPNEIKLNNILNAVDEKVKTVQCKKESKKGCNGKATKCLTHNLWDELETHINTFFEKKSLQDLLKNNSERIN